MDYNVFKLENFNIFQDENNYYFFRALNKADSKDISDGTITDENGKIIKLDVHEKAHGPHGIIAGATGSRKIRIYYHIYFINGSKLPSWWNTIRFDRL